MALGVLALPQIPYGNTAKPRAAVCCSTLGVLSLPQMCYGSSAKPPSIPSAGFSNHWFNEHWYNEHWFNSSWYNSDILTHGGGSIASKSANAAGAITRILKGNGAVASLSASASGAASVTGLEYGTGNIQSQSANASGTVSIINAPDKTSITYVEAHSKNINREIKDTDIIGITDPNNPDPNQGITMLQLKEYIQRNG